MEETLMKIKIGNTEHELNFGIKFVRILDNKNGVLINGASFGQGLTIALNGLRGYDPASLADIIHAATWAEKKRPSLAEIEAMIEDPKTDIEKLFDEVFEEISNANTTKLALKKMKA